MSRRKKALVVALFMGASLTIGTGAAFANDFCTACYLWGVGSDLWNAFLCGYFCAA